MWAILGTLCIIIVILLYYNYSTRSEQFVGSTELEVYLVRPEDGPIEVDASYTVPQAVARAFSATLATLEQVQNAFATGIVDNTIYPMWDASGIVAYNGSVVQVVLPVRPGSASGSTSSSSMGSSSSSGSGSGTTGPTLFLTTTPLPTTTPLIVQGVLLYGPKPSYERRTVGISGRNYNADFYNYERNVWSRVNDVVQYKCKDIGRLTSPTNKTYGEYASALVAILENPGMGQTVSVQITGGVGGNRTYPGCDPTCNVCEKTKSPYYPARPSINTNEHTLWKGQSINLDIDARVLNDRIPPSGKTDPSKLTSSLRLIDACKAAGGIPSLSIEDKGQYTGCPATSWCCAPDTDIPIVLPLAEDDPASDTVGKTCDETEEAECDAAPRPAPNDTDAYRLSKGGQRSRITAAAKRQFCKAKSASIRTLAQERKSEKLLKRLANK